MFKRRDILDILKVLYLAKSQILLKMLLSLNKNIIDKVRKLQISSNNNASLFFFSFDL